MTASESEFMCEFCGRAGTPRGGFGAVPFRNGRGTVEHCPRHLQAAIDAGKRNSAPPPPSSPAYDFDGGAGAEFEHERATVPDGAVDQRTVTDELEQRASRRRADSERARREREDAAAAAKASGCINPYHPPECPNGGHATECDRSYDGLDGADGADERAVDDQGADADPR